MSDDLTQHQTDGDHDRSRQLSMQPTDSHADIPGVQITRLLGTGAYGEVWVGVDINTNRQVAVKFFHHQSGVDWQLLSKEVEKLVSLATQRYVVQLLDVGWEATPPYYVMEYLEDGSLDQFIKTADSISVQQAVELFHDITTGLTHAHNKGILHCDLKPANILLDADRRPRIADFGQSRLSTDQSPALGTLFFMAPEQADLDASPDPRWDVYGLGAILYTLLEGSAPNRSENDLKKIETSGGLKKRLKSYQATINNAGNPADSMLRSDIDPPLREIIRKCLAVDPQERFSSVRDILDALRHRQTTRDRRPLTILGIFGPILLLAIMTVFSSLWYQQAVADAELAVRERVYESNKWISRHVALSVKDELRNYFDIVEQESSQGELLDLITTILGSTGLQSIHNNRQPWATLTPSQKAFLNDPQRKPLDKFLKARIQHYQQAHVNAEIASLFVVSPNGDMLGIAFSPDEIRGRQSIGRYYGYRNYFHGGPRDLPQDIESRRISPISNTHLSRAFQSTTTNKWKIAITTPIYMPAKQADPTDPPNRGELIGIMAVTVNLGDFSSLKNDNLIDNQFAVFIDGRAGSEIGEGQRRGTILQHPAMDELDSTPDKPFQLSAKQLRGLLQGQESLYTDPMGEATNIEKYRGKWIAVLQRVETPAAANREESNLRILVQENYSQATLPIRELGRKLILEGIFAAAVILIVVSALWFFVIRKFSQPIGKT
ncbi:MAG: protein kinase [Planctomycetaceae bacterium]|nr:protein kinase [Planctomycetaceae bacterium]